MSALHGELPIEARLASSLLKGYLSSLPEGLGQVIFDQALDYFKSGHLNPVEAVTFILSHLIDASKEPRLHLEVILNNEEACRAFLDSPLTDK